MTELGVVILHYGIIQMSATTHTKHDFGSQTTCATELEFLLNYTLQPWELVRLVTVCLFKMLEY